jgi:hypothetical protein
VQRRIERLVSRCAGALGVSFAGIAALLLALGVTTAMSAPATAGKSVSLAAYLAVIASLLGHLGRLRVDADGGMIPASAIYKSIQNHPLDGYGIVAVLTILAGLAATL